MTRKIKKYQQSLVIILIVICMGIIIAGGVRYVGRLRHNLQANAAQNIMAVAVQQERAFDTSVQDNWDRIHGFTEFFIRNSICNPEKIRQLLTLPNETDVVYMVMCLDGWLGMQHLL